MIGPGYRWPIRMRDWELWRTMDAVERRGKLGCVLDTGSYNTFLPLWLARRAGSVIASDLLGRRWRRNFWRRIGILPRKPTEPPFGAWKRALTGGAPNLGLQTVNLSKIPFGDGHFDCITSVSVIEHTPDPALAMKEMIRCLKPGGVLLLTTDCSPEPIPFVRGTRAFSYQELVGLVGPCSNPGGCPQPSFERENWCYGREQPIVTAFVEIEKPGGARPRE